MTARDTLSADVINRSLNCGGENLDTEQWQALHDMALRTASLELAMRNILLAAARGLSFGRQATPQTPEKMIARRDVALESITSFCGTVGITGSPLRDEVGSANDYIDALESAEQRAASLEAVLLELVRLKDLHDRIEHEAMEPTERDALEDEYVRCKPLAWTAARNILGGKT